MNDDKVSKKTQKRSVWVESCRYKNLGARIHFASREVFSCVIVTPITAIDQILINNS